MGLDPSERHIIWFASFQTRWLMLTKSSGIERFLPINHILEDAQCVIQQGLKQKCSVIVVFSNLRWWCLTLGEMLKCGFGDISSPRNDHKSCSVWFARLSVHLQTAAGPYKRAVEIKTNVSFVDVSFLIHKGNRNMKTHHRSLHLSLLYKHELSIKDERSSFCG